MMHRGGAMRLSREFMKLCSSNMRVVWHTGLSISRTQ
jgi:hypothetical protein